MPVPEIIQQLIADGAMPGSSTPGEFAAFIRERTATVAQLIKVANIRPE